MTLAFVLDLAVGAGVAAFALCAAHLRAERHLALEDRWEAHRQVCPLEARASGEPEDGGQA